MKITRKRTTVNKEKWERREGMKERKREEELYEGSEGSCVLGGGGGEKGRNRKALE